MSIGPWDFGGFDIVVLLILGISGIMAFARGFMREIVSIIALIAGIIAALFLFGRFQGKALDLIQPAWLGSWALGLGAFFVAYLLVTFILRSGTKKLQGREPGFFDKLLGFGFGVFRGILISSLILIVFGRIFIKDDKLPDWLEKTTFYPILSPVAETMLSMPFAQIKDAAAETIEKGRELDNTAPKKADDNDR